MVTSHVAVAQYLNQEINIMPTFYYDTFQMYKNVERIVHGTSVYLPLIIQ